MKIFRTSLAITAVALSVGLPSFADANGLREKGKTVSVAKSPMTVTPGRDWNQLSIKPGKKAETWTLDGEQLNDVTWFGGIGAGEALIRETSKKRKPLPKFTRATLLVELPELLEATYRSEKGIATFTVIASSPDRFLDHSGIRFTYEYVDRDNLPRKGEARATIVNGRLFMMTFDAPRIYYFDRSLNDVHALSDSAKI